MPGLDVVIGVEKVIAVQLINNTSKWLLQSFYCYSINGCSNQVFNRMYHALNKIHRNIFF